MRGLTDSIYPCSESCEGYLFYMGSLAESPFLGFRVEYQRELGKRGNEIGGGYECATGIYLLGEAY